MQPGFFYAHPAMSYQPERSGLLCSRLNETEIWPFETAATQNRSVCPPITRIDANQFALESALFFIRGIRVIRGQSMNA